MMSSTDEKWMRAALELAEHGLRNTDPNPTVGCVIVADEQCVGQGWTAPAGGPHAERVALAEAGEHARGATAYITLEPCCHTGRTEPCTDALIAAGIARVVFAIEDPNPEVAGKGASTLRNAGIATHIGPFATDARALNQGFFSRMFRGRPWLRLKVAVSLDGRTALANGRSQWITSAEARFDVHGWRARSSAVMTGIGTVLADDPALNARVDGAFADKHQPMRVIVDSTLRTPYDAKLFKISSPVRIYTRSARRQDDRSEADPGQFGEQVSVHAVDPDVDGHCDLHAVLRDLGKSGVNDVWVEAGSRFNGALLAAGLVDELIIYMAPTILGSDARGMFDIPVLDELAHSEQFEIVDVLQVGPDLRVTARAATVSRP